MHKHAALILGLTLLAGCGDRTTTEPEHPAFLSADGRLHHVTASGREISGEMVGGDAVQFAIRDGQREFGVRLSEGRVFEWATDGVQRDEVSIDYRTDEVTYTVNGRIHPRSRHEIPRWEPARAGAGSKDRSESPRPLGIPIDELLVFDNELGDELARTLNGLGREIHTSGQWFDEDGSCSGDFMAVLGGCMRFKCPFGGVANPVCHVCTGTFVACLVAAVWVLGGGGM